jgi:hypothetical protein
MPVINFWQSGCLDDREHQATPEINFFTPSRSSRGRCQLRSQPLHFSEFSVQLTTDQSDHFSRPMSIGAERRSTALSITQWIISQHNLTIVFEESKFPTGSRVEVMNDMRSSRIVIVACGLNTA